MQHYPPHRALNGQQTSFLNEHITSTTRFHRLLEKVQSEAIEQLDYRRERQVYLLTNGQRTIGQIASLLAMHPVEVAHMMKQLLALGYIELLPAIDAP
ncbi:MAG: hypothetical protein ACRDIV_22305 [Ktedonobacteraceae bacterium]